MQPFLENFTDVRVIIVGGCIKAYMRHNPYNFRMNISSGGKSYPFNLDSNKKKLCRDIMERGKFPYAHIDFQITESEKCYLSEIALNGGIKGADVSRRELDQKKEELLECLAEDIQQIEAGGQN
jgi:ribosomal protein S6--L-glutamate ligase